MTEMVNSELFLYRNMYEIYGGGLDLALLKDNKRLDPPICFSFF